MTARKRSPEYSARRHLDKLGRRRDYLARQLHERQNADVLHHYRAELAALNWAIRTLENAVNLGLLADLESVTR